VIGITQKNQVASHLPKVAIKDIFKKCSQVKIRFDKREIVQMPLHKIGLS
jgi:hypothetical protein